MLDTPPGSPKNCPEAKGGSVRVQISLSRPVSFFMVKPRLSPRQDQSSPLHSSRPLGFGQVLSDQPVASRLEHYENAWTNCRIDVSEELGRYVATELEPKLGRYVATEQNTRSVAV
ncbi:hypothetical protein F2Q69_00050709 [Brassica cretica]|uniref:Uncharacterized protein n=1 Tax=Brassica cretica TaxID=69181 RepID=A0A8S9PTJ2_BRACR|nr:hypothetical protein F2Q69_00050709 [Brassica cretica]